MAWKHGKILLIVTVLILATLSAMSGRARGITPSATLKSAGNPAVAEAVTAVPQQTTVPIISAPQPMALQRTGAMVEPLADGAKNPASISDEVALRALLMSLAMPANNPAVSETAVLRAKVGRMKLDEADMTILTQGLGRFRGLATAQGARIAVAREAGRGNPTPAAFANVVAEDRQLDTLVADSYRELLRSLSPEGAARLQEHLAYVKTKIKIVPPPNMSMPRR